MKQAPLVAHIFPTFAVGGAQMRFVAIANHFGPAFRHIVVALDGDLGCRQRLRPDLDVSFPQVTAAKNAMLANAWCFRRLLRDWQPDVLVTCNWGAIEFALANIRPVTRHLHVIDGFGPEEQQTRLPRRILLRRLALGRSPVILPSQNLVRIVRDTWKLPPGVIRYIPNGIDLARFAIDGATQGATPPVTRPAIGPVIGTVAALRPEKHLGRLLRAYATLPAGRLIIVGEGPERPALTALAAELGITDRVEFAGQQSDTPAFYARFDIFALSSDTEQMPLSLIEAMAAGLPVVSTDVGDVRLMVAEANTPFITSLNDAALAAALATLAADPAARRRIGTANLQKAQRDYDQSAMFAAHAALWRGAAAAGQGDPTAPAAHERRDPTSHAAHERRDPTAPAAHGPRDPTSPAALRRGDIATS